MPLLQIVSEDVADSGFRGMSAAAREASKMSKESENSMVVHSKIVANRPAHSERYGQYTDTSHRMADPCDLYVLTKESRCYKPPSGGCLK